MHITVLTRSNQHNALVRLRSRNCSAGCQRGPSLLLHAMIGKHTVHMDKHDMHSGTHVNDYDMCRTGRGVEASPICR